MPLLIALQILVINLLSYAFTPATYGHRFLLRLLSDTVRIIPEIAPDVHTFGRYNVQEYRHSKNEEALQKSSNRLNNSIILPHHQRLSFDSGFAQPYKHAAEI